MNPHHKPWTADEIESLRMLRRSGKSIAEIASILGRGPTAVESKLGKARPEPEPVVDVPAPHVHKNLTARIFGDPPPGRSALDQRSQA